jgi:hypothetical protein
MWYWNMCSVEEEDEAIVGIAITLQNGLEGLR